VPGQTVNVDLCFVPASHAAELKLPAVSGSSGRLVIERLRDDGVPHDYPGRVFEDNELDYTQAMLAFAAASMNASSEAPAPVTTAEEAEKRSLRVQRQALGHEAGQLREQRRQTRAQRKQEDAAWTALRAQRRTEQAAQRAQSKTERKQQRKQRRARGQAWQQLRQQRQAQHQQRAQEDEQWRQHRQSLRERLSLLPIVTAWIAVLVMTDNCTRQCLGLPLFVTGPQVTSELIVEALRALLPAELLFLITDRGTHFTSKVFKELMRSEEFIHILIARHRPESNGIAERFVRTLKAWLRDKSWETDQELTALLQQFLFEYNDCPHQGLPIPGLSPNEFAERIWLM
jgi:transposase InsO family protein